LESNLSCWCCKNLLVMITFCWYAKTACFMVRRLQHVSAHARQIIRFTLLPAAGICHQPGWEIILADSAQWTLPAGADRHCSQSMQSEGRFCLCHSCAWDRNAPGRSHRCVPYASWVVKV
jgi:hypothetical protein